MLRLSQRRITTWSVTLFVCCAIAAGCGAEDAYLGDAGVRDQLTETVLQVDLGFVAGNPGDSTTVRITTRDGTTPVRTDIWLYTLVAGQLQELDAFTATTNRKSGRLLLPATLGGVSSNLCPADDGRVNGLMTNGDRGSLVEGAFVSAIDGTVMVTLQAPPSDPIVVVAGVEDQRYAGAAVLMPDGSPGVVPAGVGAPQIHERVSYERDVAPIVAATCLAGCHHPTGPFDAALYLMDTRDHLVNNNFALAEETARCQTMFPDDSAQRTDCVHGVTAAEFLVEPGAPALSDLLLRARPDEALGTSPLGLAWYGGSKKVRYNADYGDRRMPSTTLSTTMADWTNVPTYFDVTPNDYQVLYNWVAQGALP